MNESVCWLYIAAAAALRSCGGAKDGRKEGVLEEGTEGGQSYKADDGWEALSVMMAFQGLSARERKMGHRLFCVETGEGVAEGEKLFAIDEMPTWFSQG